MGKRGPHSKVTPELVETIRERYQGGAPHRVIADEVKISETNIRRILRNHGIEKRPRKLATLLSPAEETYLVDFLVANKTFRGKYRDLRNLMGNFAAERGIRCPFTYSWRNGFVKRHASNRQIPLHLLHLLSPKKIQLRSNEIADPEFEDPDLTVIASTIQKKQGSAIPVATSIDLNAIQNPAILKTVTTSTLLMGPSVWKQKPKLTLVQRAVKESTKAFLKAGLTREEAHELLVKLKVPGIAVEPGHDVVAAAISDVFGGEANIEPELAQVVADQEAAQLPKASRRIPQKKDQLQIELLEKVYEESPVCGDQRAKKLSTVLGLTPAQIIYWFHNTARHKRKLNSVTPAVTVEETTIVTEVPHDFNTQDAPVFVSNLMM
ncbi:hypothetical protein BV898_12668 [Hypsibius exemplaris]|uniref:Homeobox domain-containing protein n=1 Tax=Hypsibius exemplaris TaxID=2072580 RepID=A0A1W0WD61_HYPEX|nr:hypothetical protein BV898_12668 [Hypsibius exemplaris]